MANISNYLTFGIDALKQDAMVLRFRNQNEIAAAATVLVEDSATSLSADRGFTFYEYNGMLKQAFGDERRLGIEDRLYQDRAYMNRLSPFYGQPFYLLSEYDGRGPTSLTGTPASFTSSTWARCIFACSARRSSATP